MKMQRRWQPVGITMLVLLLALAWRALAQPAEADNQAGSDSQPTGQVEVAIPAAYRPGPAAVVGGPGSTEVYFAPQDENTSTTVLFLYNTGTTTATVGIETFRVNGTTYINTAVDVPPAGLVRIVGDSVSTVSGSWSNPVLVNFTTNSAYGRLTLPADVKAEAFVAWNGASPYDPLDAVPTLPIRFSTDPPTLFMPAIERP